MSDAGNGPKQPPRLTRRDWLKDVSASIGSSLIVGTSCKSKPKPRPHDNATDRPTEEPYAPEKAADYYPPARTGIRGDHDGSFEAAHEIRKGLDSDALAKARADAEQYDLVVVGGGISGLSAAHFYRQRFGAAAKILILENHDDVGGHATRNEFSVAGKLRITYGGSQSIAGPSSFSDVTKGLMRDLGIEMSVFDQAYDRKLFAKLDTGLFFDRDTYGRDQLLVGMYRKPWKKLLAKAPLSEPLRLEIIRIYTEKRDYLAPMTLEQKQQLLRKISYAEYLTKYCRLAPEALVFFQSFPHDLFAVGIDGVSAWSCYHGVDDFGAFVYPGFEGLGLPAPEQGEPYIHHFPDGNASVARLLVRALVPAALPGSSMHDVVLARLDYAKLDEENAPVRIRLNSTVIHARHGTSTSGGGRLETPPRDAPKGSVEVFYKRGGELRRVTAKHGVFACHNAMIPYLCPELPPEQRKALAYLVRMPLLYTHVALRNWRSFANLGINQIVSPNSYHTYTALDFPVSLGGYEYSKSPDDPAILFMLRVPCRPGLPRRDQNRVGRWELLNTDLQTYERRVRDQLSRMLDGTGFDASRDITGITVNRWAHGYSFIPNRLFDPEWADDAKPWVIGRRPCGSFTIANSDAGASAYMEVAIEQAWRAVAELPKS